MCTTVSGVRDVAPHKCSASSTSRISLPLHIPSSGPPFLHKDKADEGWKCVGVESIAIIRLIRQLSSQCTDSNLLYFFLRSSDTLSYESGVQDILHENLILPASRASLSCREDPC